MKVKRIPAIDRKILVKTITDLGNTVAEVGWFSAAKYEDGTPVAYVASVQEFGSDSPPIPPRLGMRDTIKEQNPKWQQLIQAEAKKMLVGKSTPEKVLGRAAIQAQGDFQKTISQVTTPPLSPVTIVLRAQRKRRRKAAKPDFVGPSRSTRTTGYDVGEAYKQAYFVGPRRRREKGIISLAGVSTKPLLDTRFMYNSLTYVVKKK